jgi:hypothetical protein
LAGNSLEFVGAAVIEGDTRTDHGVPDGLRDEDFVGPCERADSGSDVNGDAATPARTLSPMLCIAAPTACAHRIALAGLAKAARIRLPSGRSPCAEVVQLAADDVVVTPVFGNVP